MEIEFGRSKMGITGRRHRVFPLPVPAVIMLSCPFKMASEAWSWKGRGMIVKWIISATMRHACSASVFSRVWWGSLHSQGGAWCWVIGVWDLQVDIMEPRGLLVWRKVGPLHCAQWLIVLAQVASHSITLQINFQYIFPTPNPPLSDLNITCLHSLLNGDQIYQTVYQRSASQWGRPIDGLVTRLCSQLALILLSVCAISN